MVSQMWSLELSWLDTSERSLVDLRNCTTNVIFMPCQVLLQRGILSRAY